jgi:cyanoexosortase A
MERHHSLWPLLLAESIYLALILWIGDRAHLGMSLLFIGAAGLLLWERPLAPQPQGGWGRWAGLALLAGVVAACLWLWGRGLNTTEGHPLRLLPLLALVGWVLWREGWRGLGGRWREALMLFALGGPHLLADWAGLAEPLARWGARDAGYLLWYLGVEARVTGAEVWVPGGAILVTPGCSGTDLLTYLLGIAVVALLLFPLERPRWGLVLGIAAACAYLVNLTRLALLALLNAGSGRVVRSVLLAAAGGGGLAPLPLTESAAPPSTTRIDSNDRLATPVTA